MNPKAVEIFGWFRDGTIDRETAVKKLIGLGFDPSDCETLLFQASGGSDVVLEGPDGHRYFVTGETETLMDENGDPVGSVRI